MLRFCCDDFADKYRAMLNMKDGKNELTTAQQQYIEQRYLGLIDELHSMYALTTAAYYCFSVTIVLTGVAITALSSAAVTSSATPEIQKSLAWSILGLSIALNISKQFMLFFLLDKRSLMADITLQKLKSEGWLFAERLGNYAVEARYEVFCHRIEAIHVASLDILSGKKSPADILAMAPMDSSSSESSDSQTASNKKDILIQI